MPVAGQQTIDRAACPFCGLGCDDLRLEVANDAVRVTNTDCARAAEGFGGPASATPAIDGKAASLDAATARAAEILAASRAPVVHGMAADIAGQRAALALARRIGGAVDHLAGDGMMRNLQAMRESGWITASLAEIRNRADLIVSFGDPARAIPRFWERVAFPPATLARDVPPARAVVLLGEGIAREGAEVLRMPQDAMPAVVAALAALAQGGKVFADPVGGIAVADLARLVERLKGARYGVVAWDAAAMAFPEADLTVAAIAALLRALNGATRAVGLPLGGAGNAPGAQASALWLAGVAPRLRFVRGEARHDAVLWSAGRMIAAGECDALLWIDAFTRRPPPTAPGVPLIALARPGATFAAPPAVFVPVATPGLDHAGHVLRGDAIVALRLDRLRESKLSGVEAVVKRIADSLPSVMAEHDEVAGRKASC